MCIYIYIYIRHHIHAHFACACEASARLTPFMGRVVDTLSGALCRTPFGCFRNIFGKAGLRGLQVII